MNQEVKEFLTAYIDYMYDLKDDTEKEWECARIYTESFLEEKASELEVTVDYYMQEFI
jgi:hypothetical protein